MKHQNVMVVPLAYHIVFNTYGSWLVGDPRGWTRRDGDEPLIPGNAALHARHRERLLHAPVTLTFEQRKCVSASLVETCEHYGWPLFATATCTQHVHVVVSAPVSAERIMVALKARATRMLREAQPAFAHPKPWSRHAYAHALWSQPAIERVVNYVLDDHHRMRWARGG